MLRISAGLHDLPHVVHLHLVRLHWEQNVNALQMQLDLALLGALYAVDML